MNKQFAQVQKLSTSVISGCYTAAVIHQVLQLSSTRVMQLSSTRYCSCHLPGIAAAIHQVLQLNARADKILPDSEECEGTVFLPNLLKRAIAYMYSEIYAFPKSLALLLLH